MCGQNATRITKCNQLPATLLAGASIALSLAAVPALAQSEIVLEEITVTAQKREEALQDVPISVATMSGDRYDVLFSGSEDVLALSGRVPGLYAESSNGRAAPRFYVRGLGNVDFDLAASQPVSIVMDEVVMENVVLKSFPLFDMQQVEVIRGPQGTLFGRNTTAGIIKFNTVRPSHETSGYAKGSWAKHDTINIEGAVGGSLIDGELAARVSVLKRSRDNWVTNGFTGVESLGEFDEAAGRIQLDWTPNDQFSALLSYQRRDLDGTSALFRANIFDTGSNQLNNNYDRETVYYDGGDDNPQGYDSTGITLNLQWDFDEVSVISITSWQDSDGSSRGDIDGGVVDFTNSVPIPPGIDFDPNGLGGIATTFPGTIAFPSVSEDGADTDQFTQEFRIASQTDGPLSWQLGAFYFDSDLVVTTESFASFGFVSRQDTKIQQQNKTWAVFGQASYDVTDRMTLTAGVRHTDDEKDFQTLQFSQLWLDLGIPTFLADPINVDDNQLSWEVSANFAASDSSSLYVRYADGFRAQTIQGRDVAFLGAPTVAVPETINSVEAGYKAELANNRVRLNIGAFWYEVDDMQLSIIGGASNTNQVINANKGEATGFEIDAEFLVTENFLVTAGVGFNDTELKDSTLATVPCGSGICTPTDPVDPTDAARVLLDGNPFPNSPESTYNLTLRYGFPMGNDAELYFFTDWVWYGEKNIFLYEAVEFETDSQFEGGVRVGYKNYETGWEVAAFGRNITDEDNVLGAIDFNNNTGFVNEPATWGVEVAYEFGD
ncbi:MAG: TonB-dependent receptor [Gammaproteobacteria bacterium]|nr:TonB-dependent receptor [Gammaproteobacteria bacterium]